MSDWQELPPPPSPTGINLFPPNPPRVVAWSEQLPNPDGRSTPGWAYRNITLKIFEWWQPLFQVTATKDAPYQKTIEVVEGTEITDVTTTTVTKSLGLKIGGIVEIGTNISSVTSHTVKLFSSKKTNTVHSVAPKNDVAVSVAMWQKATQFQFRGERIQLGSLGGFEAYEESFLHLHDIYPMTQFPPLAELEHLQE
jgi:hypothetical protein